MSNKIVAQFTPEKETKGTIKFAEVTAPPVEPMIGTLYVRKSALDHLGWNESGASALEVTIEIAS